MSLQRDLAESLFRAENEIHASLMRPRFVVKGDDWHIDMHPSTWDALRADVASVLYVDKDGEHASLSMVGWDSFMGVPVRVDHGLAEGLVKLRFETTLLGGG